MEDIITQKFSFATITPLKDYCRLDERRALTYIMRDGLDELDEVDIFQNTIKSGLTRVTELLNKPSVGKIVSLPEKNKRKVFFFESNEPIQERFQVKYVLKNGNNSFDTTKDQQIKRHYGNPFSEVSITTVERSVRRRDDKVTIKVYIGHKHRRFNCIYFKKNFIVYSITINTKTGNFTTATLSKNRKVTNKKFRTNSFKDVKFIIGGILSVGGHIQTGSRLKNDFNDSFDDLLFTTKIQNALSIDLGCVSYGKHDNLFIKDLIGLFIKTKKIKVPDGDYEYWLTNLYPTEKFLKKNDRKLIASILDMVNLKSKYLIKILHEYPTIDFFGVYSFCQFFGADFAKYVANINPGVFKNSHRKESKTEPWLTKTVILNSIHLKYDLYDNEKENLIKIVNSVDYNSTEFFSERMIQLFQDHFKMIGKVREYDTTCSMKARTMTEFNDEHRELSKIISAIKKGWVIEYEYDIRTITDIESPIDAMINLGSEEEPVLGDLNMKLYPYILKREEDYTEEGGFMHHCVASYADKDRSIIVSLRSENQMDRVTCEYDIQTGRCVQERYFCNAQPPNDYVLALKYLKSKIEKHARFGTLNWKEKKKVPIKINGVEIVPTSPRRFEDVFGFNRMPF
jgi:hypothetical protein